MQCKDILTAETEEYREQHGHVGLTREDVTMLKILEAKLEREGREQSLKQGLEQGRIKERLANVESMLELWGSRRRPSRQLPALTRSACTSCGRSWADCKWSTTTTLINRPQGDRTVFPVRLRNARQQASSRQSCLRQAFSSHNCITGCTAQAPVCTATPHGIGVASQVRAQVIPSDAAGSAGLCA